MADFGNPKAELAAFAQKLRDKAASEGATPPTEQPQNIQQVAPATPEAPQASIPVSQPASSEPVAQPPVATEPPKTDPKAVSTDPPPAKEEDNVAWDADLTTAQLKPEEPLTLERISSALKLDKLTSEEDLVAQFNQRETRIKELETAQGQQYADLPDELVDVLKVAKQKGDWKAFLGERVIDYTNANPVDLFEQQVELSPRFRKADGTIDYDAVDLELNGIPQATKEVMGNQIKQNLIAQQQLRRRQIVEAADRKQSEFNKSLSEASVKLNELLPKDKFGITLEPKHSDLIYRGIRDGSLIKKHLGNIDVSGVDPKALVATIAKAEWAENISKFQYTQGKTAGKKEMLAEKQNVNLNTPHVPINPEIQGEKPKTAAERLMASQKFAINDGRPRL